MFLAAASVSGCAAVPVQEMSDARQAMRSAEQVGAEKLAPDEYKEALQLLDDADYFISVGRYEVAKVVAARARKVAIEARRTARKNAQLTVPK